MSKIEYLKKYMSSSNTEEKKIKKKKLRPILKARGGIKIVDEEIDLRKIAAGFEKDEDQLDTQEDAPMVAGVVDERSVEMKTKQDFVESSKWKRLGADEDDGSKSKFRSNPNSDQNHKPRKDAMKIPVTKKEKNGSDSDPSPPRKRHDSDSDPSPPRKRQDSDSDPSPPRRKRHDSDSDPSPPRRRRNGSDSDASPPRRPNKNVDKSPPRRPRGSDSDQSPPRKRQDSENAGKLTKTLDGKRAGLQTGRALREETEEFRRREEEAFRKMDKSLTGQNATTAIRAGKLREIEAKQQVDKEKAEKLAKLQEAYQKWNKGLKQGEEQSTRLQEDVHEMSKPLARFAGDEDLERLLREQDREGDPMAAYMAKKRAKSGGDGKGKALRPVYRGPAAAPNRFGILPGYRWDGVDRSNGYEKMYFEKQNKAMAIQEEAYKWSVSDM